MLAVHAACGTLAQHKEPDGLAEAIIEYEVAASLKDRESERREPVPSPCTRRGEELTTHRMRLPAAEARALNYEYQERFKKFLERPEGSEAEETIATATQALLNVVRSPLAFSLSSAL